MRLRMATKCKGYTYRRQAETHWALGSERISVKDEVTEMVREPPTQRSMACSVEVREWVGCGSWNLQIIDHCRY